MPAWNGPEEPIQQQIRRAFTAQSAIGWDQFFRGQIAKAWRIPIGMYYKLRQPGDSFTPDQWMRTVIKELWAFSTTIWKQRNAELHGTDGAISMEQQRKDTANTRLWQCTSQPSVKYPQWTVLCCIILASRKFSNGRRSIWMPILPLRT
jgi:hypothetical protein